MSNRLSDNSTEDDLSRWGKAFAIPKELVWQSYKQVKANRGSAGCDGQTISQFDEHRDRNLYKIWNRLSSGSYFPPPVLRKEIPKPNGKVRVLGIPTVSDRVAQGAVKIYLENQLDRQFHEDSYGYRPNRCAHDALDVTRKRCYRHDWLLEVDIKGFFDNVRHDLILSALSFHKVPVWVQLYAGRWLKASMINKNREIVSREIGTPQGGVISPLLANLFLHYGVDRWMDRTYGDNPFARYADDLVIHCPNGTVAERIKDSLAVRMAEIGLELHPEKTKVVYVGRGGNPPNVAREFTFLGYDFKERTLKDRHGNLFRRIAPGASMKAMKEMTWNIKQWKLHRSTEASLQEIANRYNATLRGWINYYDRYCYRQFSYHLWSVFQSRLVKWYSNKYRLSQRQAEKKLKDIRKKNPNLFAHWALLKRRMPHSRAV